MSDIERMRGELLADIVKDSVSALSEILDLCRDDADDDLTRAFSRFDLVAGSTPELIFKEAAPVIHKNIKMVREENIDAIVREVRELSQSKENTGETVLVFALEWWKNAPSGSKRVVKKNLERIHDNYQEFLEEGLVV